MVAFIPRSNTAKEESTKSLTASCQGCTEAGHCSYCLQVFPRPTPTTQKQQCKLHQLPGIKMPVDMMFIEAMKVVYTKSVLSQLRSSIFSQSSLSKSSHFGSTSTLQPVTLCTLAQMDRERSSSLPFLSRYQLVLSVKGLPLALSFSDPRPFFSYSLPVHQ